jgi:hypothetical protein
MDALERIIAEQEKENRKLAETPCSKDVAERQVAFLKGWAKKKPIRKVGGLYESKLWQAGKWMTQIPANEVTGIVTHGLGKLEGSTLVLF